MLSSYHWPSYPWHASDPLGVVGRVSPPSSSPRAATLHMKDFLWVQSRSFQSPSVLMWAQFSWVPPLGSPLCQWRKLVLLVPSDHRQVPSSPWSLKPSHMLEVTSCMMLHTWSFSRGEWILTRSDLELLCLHQALPLAQVPSPSPSR